MSKKLILLALAVVFMATASGQRLELTFTAVHNVAYAQLDSITVMNRTQGGDTTLYWPDTVLVLDFYVGVPTLTRENEQLRVYQNYPNPVTGHTTVSIFIPGKDHAGILILDRLGRVILKSDRLYDRGIHSFRVSPGYGNLFFFVVHWRGETSSIKIVQSPSGSGRPPALEYLGSDEGSSLLKTSIDTQNFEFDLGDEMLCVGYVNGFESGQIDTLETSKTYTFQFATNIPCPGTPTVTYEGQIYNTIQIFSQCWLRENLNVGVMIPGNRDISDEGIIEKYCYNDDPVMCEVYGGLYQWNEMMHFTTHRGTQGICPPGWHIPGDEEWKVLEGAVDTQLGIGDNVWDGNGYRGIDAGTNLKSTIGWNNGGNGTDLFYFSGLPGGYRHFYGFFDLLGDHGYWWSSTESDTYFAWFRYLGFNFPGVIRNTNYKEFGLSVRCIKD